MPYIITTNKTVQHDVVRGEPSTVVLSRHAVATLEDARDYVRDVRRGYAPTWFGELGGTTGPLPDGTVIEVEPCNILDLAQMAGYQIYSYAWQRPEFEQPTDDRIIDTYNAAQAVA